MTDFNNNSGPFITDNNSVDAPDPNAAPVLNTADNHGVNLGAAAQDSINAVIGPNQGVPPPVATAPDAGVSASAPTASAPAAPYGKADDTYGDAANRTAPSGGAGDSGGLLGRILFGALKGAVSGAGATQPGVRGGAAFGAGVRAASGMNPQQQELKIAQQKAQTERAVALSTIQRNVASATYWASKQAALEESRERLAHPGFTPTQAASTNAQDLKLGILSHVAPVAEISAAPATNSEQSDAADAATE